LNIYLILLNKNNLSYASFITLKRLPPRSKKNSINLYAPHSIKYKKHILKNLTFSISSANHKYPPINEQTKYLFLKHKFGLFKNLPISSKIVKNQLINLSNFIKFNKFGRRTNLFPKKNKIFFYKKINKLHFRAGRKLFTSFIKIKKNYTQTFLSKRIYSTIKGDLLQQLQPRSLILILLSTNLFYTYNDINFFVSNLGV
jgi:hypothetical protein